MGGRGQRVWRAWVWRGVVCVVSGVVTSVGLALGLAVTQGARWDLPEAGCDVVGGEDGYAGVVATGGGGAFSLAVDWVPGQTERWARVGVTSQLARLRARRAVAPEPGIPPAWEWVEFDDTPRLAWWFGLIDVPASGQSFIGMHAWGWPAPAVACWEPYPDAIMPPDCGLDTPVQWAWVGRADLPEWAGSAVPWGHVPWVVQWRGLALNAAVLGALWWVPLVLVGQVRREVRWRRGRCAWCAYDVRGVGDGVCPECGASVREADPDAGTPAA